MTRPDGLVRTPDGDLVPDGDLLPLPAPTPAPARKPPPPEPASPGPWEPLTEEQLEVNRRGLAMCRAALAEKKPPTNKETNR